MELGIPFIGGDGWDSSDLDLASAAGSYFVNHFSTEDPRSRVREFVSAYRNAFPDDTGLPALAALAYDAAQMLFQAIDAAGYDDPSRVRDALESIRFEGVTGILTFDSSHDPRKTGVIMAVDQDGVHFETEIDPRP